MYRFFSSIRHGLRSSLASLLAPKPALPFDAALRPRRLPQNHRHLREFSTSNLDWRRLIVNQNVNADANAHPDSMQDIENRNSEKWNNMRQNMNADAHAPPNFVQNSGNINSRSWNNMRQNVNAPPNFIGNRENINSRSQNNLGQNVDANADALPDIMQDKENINIRNKNDAEKQQEASHSSNSNSGDTPFGSSTRVQKLIASQSDPLLAKEIFDLTSRQPKFRHTYSTYLILLLKLGRSKHFSLLDDLLRRLKFDSHPITPTLFTYLIKVYVEANLPDKALKTFYTILHFNCKPLPIQIKRLRWIQRYWS